MTIKVVDSIDTFIMQNLPNARNTIYDGGDDKRIALRHIEYQLTSRILRHFTIGNDPPRRDVKQRFRTRLKDDSPTCRELSVEGAFGEPDAVQSEIAGMDIFHVPVC